MFWSVAYAQTAAAAPTAEQPSFLMSMIPFVVIFGVMYFLMIRPQGKRQREHQKFLSELKRGDEIVTSAGILGRIEGLTEKFVTLEISEGVRVKVLRSQVMTSAKTLTEPAPAKS